jgi:hypothetical protein
MHFSFFLFSFSSFFPFFVIFEASFNLNKVQFKIIIWMKVGYLRVQSGPGWKKALNIYLRVVRGDWLEPERFRVRIIVPRHHLASRTRRLMIIWAILRVRPEKNPRPMSVLRGEKTADGTNICSRYGLRFTPVHVSLPKNPKLACFYCYLVSCDKHVT